MRSHFVSHRPGRSRLLLLALVCMLMASIVVVSTGMVAGAATQARSAPRLKNPAVTGRALSNEYLTILQRGDVAALAKFLDPVYQLQRADGSGADRTEFLANPAQIATFTIDDAVQARQHGDVLTVRWGVATDQTINGVPFRTGTAPRISTYRWSGTRWRLVSHANFNLPA